jgi:hypothetical protein
MYGFWFRFFLLTGIFSLFYNAKVELLPFTIKKSGSLELLRDCNPFVLFLSADDMAYGHSNAAP